MNLSISNCNNIDNGQFNIVDGCLNIKYAINGTGKSTISKAIDAFVSEDETNIKYAINGTGKSTISKAIDAFVSEDETKLPCPHTWHHHK